ncbi:MAG: hypothetical protein OXB84_00040, partial [Halobacteriovoraceae bacterium]|nr:hypothetical protein [Halobacteriovoraceae bacterium]
MNRSNSVQWTSPSNIALIKYWGKKPHQLPKNPSLSFTLKRSTTRFKLSWSKKKNDKQKTSFLFSGKQETLFLKRIKRYLKSIEEYCPFIYDYDLEMESENNFPHSAGIASSASSMSALALCLCSMEEALKKSSESKKVFFDKASFLARMASGSASRSLFSPISCWGKTSVIPHSSDLKAVQVDELHPVFSDYRDAILLVDPSAKTLQSSEGHQLMNGHIAAEKRFVKARENLEKLFHAMKTGDLETFGEIVETEALTLHGLIATSSPPHLLLKPNTLAIM